MKIEFFLMRYAVFFGKLPAFSAGCAKVFFLFARCCACCMLPTLLAPSCAVMRSFPIETLQPARLTFDAPKKNIAICAPQALLQETVRRNWQSAASVPSDSLIANALFSLHHFWKDAPGYEDALFSVHITKSGNPPADAGYDLIVRLDELQITNTYYGQEYSYFEWEAYLYVHYAAKWSVCDGRGALLDEYAYRDLLVWESGIRSGKADAVTGLPDVKDAWWDASIALARNYAARVAPQWRGETREIYMVDKFHELSQQAYIAMLNGAHARAFDIWETMLLSCRKCGQRIIKSRIALNMAVACEFQNKLDEALLWAQRSENLKHKFRAADYLELLYERKRIQAQLDRQTLNISQ
jgi:hypothetical protein